MKFLFNKGFSLLVLLSALHLISCSNDDDTPIAVQTDLKVYDFSKALDENPISGFEIGTLLASTNQGSLSFSLIEQEPEGAMALNAKSGILSVNDSNLFDFKNHPVITGIAKVTNGEVSKNINITISLNEIDKKHVYQETINLRSQAEVDAFGSNNYTHLGGTLNIGKFLDLEISDIHDLSPLYSIKSIGKNLIVALNPELQNLHGLDNVLQIKGDIFIAENESLTSIDNIKQAQGLYTAVNISSNNSLKNINGLENLKKLSVVEILDNPVLQDVDGLSGAEKIYNLSIGNNVQLEDINGLHNLTRAEGSVNISNNPSLRNIDGLTNLTHLEENLILIQNSLITNINAFENLEIFPRSIDIADNRSLQTIAGISGVESAIIRIKNNESLISLEGLNSLVSSRNLQISNNESIQNLNQLNNLISVQQIRVQDNSNLSDINGLSNLESVIRFLTIENNNNLSSLDGLGNLLQIGREIRITNNNSLTDFCALQPELFGSGFNGRYEVFNNAYNPTIEDMANGNCSL